MEKKAAAAAVLLLLVLLTCQIETIKSDAFDCYDACSTGCVASYINDNRLRQRCERKCSIRCNPGLAADPGRQ